MPRKVDPYAQTHRGEERDRAAHFWWGELSDEERERIRLQALYLFDIPGMGEKAVKTLIFALGQDGHLKKLYKREKQEPEAEPVREPTKLDHVRLIIKHGYTRVEKPKFHWNGRK